MHVVLAVAAMLVAGCATIDTYAPTLRSFGVYKLDVNQGNFLSQDMVEKLKVGQGRDQVRLILGTPLIVTLFRDDRWDYAYMFKRQGRVIETGLTDQVLDDPREPYTQLLVASILPS